MQVIIIIIDSTISNSNSESLTLQIKMAQTLLTIPEITNVDWGTDGFYFGGLEEQHLGFTKVYSLL